MQRTAPQKRLAPCPESKRWADDLTLRIEKPNEAATRAPNKSNATIAPVVGGGVPVTSHASHDEGSRRMRTRITEVLPPASRKGAAEQSEHWNRGRGRDYYYDHGGETDSENFPA